MVAPVTRARPAGRTLAWLAGLDRDMVTVAETAGLLGVWPATVIGMIHRDELDGVFVGGRWYVFRDALMIRLDMTRT
jgi:uncharacterized ferritin-like protein (DUF455 family)